jgi:hypothetical protein
MARATHGWSGGHGKSTRPKAAAGTSPPVPAKGIHVNDLAEYFDKQAAAARKECEQLRKAG